MKNIRYFIRCVSKDRKAIFKKSYFSHMYHMVYIYNIHNKSLDHLSIFLVFSYKLEQILIFWDELSLNIDSIHDRCANLSYGQSPWLLKIQEY